MRNVQPATSEEELRHLSAPYGRMVHCKVLRAKAQAFLEMEHVAAAQRLLMAAEADPERFKVQMKIVSNCDLKQIQRPSGESLPGTFSLPDLLFTAAQRGPAATSS